MLVIDMYTKENEIFEIGIINTSVSINKEDKYKDNIFVYKYGFLKEGRVDKYLGTVEHKYSDGALSLSSKVISKINLKNDLINECFDYRITISINRKKVVEEIKFLNKNKNIVFGLMEPFSDKFDNNKYEYKYKIFNLEFIIKKIFSVLDKEDTLEKMNKRIKERESKEFFLIFNSF